MRTLGVCFCVLAVTLVLALSTVADVPSLINYQGILTDSGGQPIDGQHDLTFKIYPDSMQATPPVWTEVHTGVDVDDGLFNVILGSVSSIPESLFADGERWLGTTVDSDPEMSPRMQITSVPWALRASSADEALTVGEVPAHSHHSLDAADGSPTAALYVDDAGDVGIGTTSAVRPLHVVHSIDAPARFESTDQITSIELKDPYGMASIASRSGNLELLASKIGIGLVLPAAKLHIGGTPGVDGIMFPDGTLQTTAGGAGGIGGSGGTNYIPKFTSSTTIGNSVIYQSGTDVGIGTTSPESRLDVDGGTISNVYEIAGGPGPGQFLRVSAPGAMTFVTDSNDDEPYGTFTWCVNEPTDPDKLMELTEEVGLGIGLPVLSVPSEKLDVNGTARLRVMPTGSGTTVVADANGVLKRQSSSRRYKTSIRKLEIHPEKVLGLRPVRFQWRNTGEEDIGLIAEDVEGIIPDVVIYDQEGRPDAVKYDRVTLYLLELVRQQQREISKLEQDISELKSR